MTPIQLGAVYQTYVSIVTYRYGQTNSGSFISRVDRRRRQPQLVDRPDLGTNVKYSPFLRHTLQNLVHTNTSIKLPPSEAATRTHSTMQGLIRASVANSTWRKYETGWRAFNQFEEDHQARVSWPLSPQTIRAFAVWCLDVRKLQLSSTIAYLSAVRFAHLLQGLQPASAEDPILELIFAGARHMSFSAPPRPNTRRVVTFPLLLTLGHRIAQAQWDRMSKQVTWTACTVAFFGSARMGELLAKSEQAHDPTADLLWSDVKFRGTESVLLQLKIPKSGEYGEFIDLFSFPGYNCCPVKALLALKNRVVESGMADSSAPVFKFRSGRNLTPALFNSTLAGLLADICDKSTNTISCHSFRAGLPTTLSLFPELANSDEIKHWGRWKSECYNKYTRLTHDQKMQIFAKISMALRLSVSMPG